jgi:peroxiredoxin
MTKKTLFVSLTAATLALAGTTMLAYGDDKPKTNPAETVKGKADDAVKTTKEAAKEKVKEVKDEAKQQKKGVAIGAAAPDFTLTDTSGKEVKLADLTKDKDKIVVLQWYNPGCPFIKKHYGKAGNTFNDLHAKYKDKGVIFLGINSGAKGKEGAGLEASKQSISDWNIGYQILIDESGTVGKAYDAKRTPEMFVIAKDGTIAYHGAIDDDAGADKPGSTNYVAKALDELLAGQTVSKPETRPYGCSVKY